MKTNHYTYFTAKFNISLGSEDIRKHVFITQEMWMRVIYNFYIEKKTKMVEYLYFSRSVDDKSIPDMRDIDIQPLCKIELMDKCPNLLDFITKLIAFGSDYKRLSTVVGDTYIHATVRLAIPTCKYVNYSKLFVCLIV